MSVCHGGNSDDLVSIPAMTGTVAKGLVASLAGGTWHTIICAGIGNMSA